MVSQNKCWVTEVWSLPGEYSSDCLKLLSMTVGRLQSKYSFVMFDCNFWKESPFILALLLLLITEQLGWLLVESEGRREQFCFYGQVAKMWDVFESSSIAWKNSWRRAVPVCVIDLEQEFGFCFGDLQCLNFFMYPLSSCSCHWVN